MSNTDTPKTDLEIFNELVKKERQSKEAREKIGQVLAGGIINPTVATGMFNSILLRLDLKECWTMETGATDGSSLWYNPAFIDSLTPDQVEWFLNHEALHVALAHPARACFCEDHALANVAMDLVDNHILQEAGLTNPPPGVLFPAKGAYHDIPAGLDFETTYEKLLHKKQDQQKEEDSDEEGDSDDDSEEKDEEEGDSPSADENADDDGDEEGDDGEGPGSGDGEAEDGDPEAQAGDGGAGGDGPACEDPGRCGGVVKPGDGSPAAAATQEAEAQIMMAEAEAIASQMGDLPASLKKLIEARKKKPQDWRARLRDWMVRRGKSRLGWDKPRAWGISRGIYLAGKSGKTLGKIIVAVDTSGSCWEAQPKFASELQSIVEDFPDTKLLLVYCDAAVNHVQEWDPQSGEKLVLECHGGGGTSHVPVFNWVEEHHSDVDGLICFTDLDTSFPNKRYPFDTLWAAAPGFNRSVPFGEVIFLKD